MLKQTLAVLAGALALSATAADLTINGVGASFPAPVYRVWTYGFSNVNKDIRVNYQPRFGRRNQSDQGGNREFRRNRQAAQN